jgi:1-acyl-sn-glycerol-3-phosphate acyltransferase
MAFFGSFLFNLVFYLSLLPTTLIVISLYPFISTEKLQKVGSYWVLFVLYTLKILCGVQWRVEGYSNIPKKTMYCGVKSSGSMGVSFFTNFIYTINNYYKEGVIIYPFIWLGS